MALRILNEDTGPQPTIAELVNEVRMVKMMLRRIDEKLKGFLAAEGSNLTQNKQARLIIAEVASFYDYSVTQISSHTRTAPLAWARHVAVAMVKEFTGMSFNQIGKLMERDHATIMNAVQNVADRCATEEAASAAVAKLRDKFKKLIL